METSAAPDTADPTRVPEARKFRGVGYESGSLTRLPLAADTVGPVARGHPWVWKDGVRGRAEVGEPVSLTDERGRTVGWGLFDDGPIAVRVLGREPPPDLSAFLRARLGAAEARRAPLFASDETDAFRVVNGEGDGLGGFVVDRYGEVAVVRLYTRAWERHTDALADALAGRGWVRTVFRRYGVGHVDDASGGEVLRGPEPAAVVVVREHGMRLIARLREGQKTGLFLDQRENRRLVRTVARGRTVLNLFAYSGGYGVAAALGGARRVVNVDSSPGALDDAAENFRLNGLDPGAHGFEVGDVFEGAFEPHDLVICDPPSLAHRKDQENAARRAYRDLHRRIAPAARSLLATSSCTARISWDRWEQSVREAIGAGWTALHRGAEPLDHPVAQAHPEGRYLKFLLLDRMEAGRAR